VIKHWFESGWTHHTWKSTEDSWGNPVEDWSTGSAIDGRFRPLSGDRVVRDEARNIVTDAKFYCSPDESISAGDQLRKGSDEYEVTFVQDPMDMGRFLQVEMRKL